MKQLYLVRGDDPILRAEVIDGLLERVLDGQDRTLALEDFTIPGRTSEGDEVGGSEGRVATLATALDAAQSPAFMTDRRVVVLRDIGGLTAAEATPLVAYLDDPLPTTVLILVAGGGRIAPGIGKAVKAAGEELGPATEDVAGVLAERSAAAGIKLSADANRAIVARFGEDAGRVPQLIELLVSTYGAGARLGAGEVEAYLGEAGAVPVYELTNAIEGGDVAGALEILDRMLSVTSASQPKPMHPLQVLSMMHNQVRRLALLDDPSIRTDNDAVAALGGKVKAYPAKKALAMSRRWGSDRIRAAYDVLADADLSVKGASAVPERTVVEITVARLAGMSARAGARR
jgi:DNA polymerase-3 subunit delta